jgi:hypothetical protein
MKIKAALIFLFISKVNLAQNKGSKDLNSPNSNLAVQGYDVVTYFSSEQNKTLF